MDRVNHYTAPVLPLDPQEASDDISVFVKDYETAAEIGLFASEYGRKQRVRFSVDAGCRYVNLSSCDSQQSVVCYKTIVDEIEEELGKGHVETVETLADRLCNRILSDDRVLWVSLSIEKLEAIEGADSVGIRVTRRRPGWVQS